MKDEPLAMPLFYIPAQKLAPVHPQIYHGVLFQQRSHFLSLDSFLSNLEVVLHRFVGRVFAHVNTVETLKQNNRSLDIDLISQVF